MLKQIEDFTPEKIIKIHRMLREHELYTAIKEHRPTGNEEIMYYVSKCLEVKRRERLLLQWSLYKYPKSLHSDTNINA
jgi:hypothetical protein